MAPASKATRASITGTRAGARGAHLMHDVYNFIVADHLAFAAGTSGFLVGWFIGSLQRRRKSKKAAGEVYDYYGSDEGSLP